MSDNRLRTKEPTEGPGDSHSFLVKKEPRNSAESECAVFEWKIKFINNLIETVSLPMLILDKNMVVKKANHAFFATFYQMPHSIINQSAYHLLNNDESQAELNKIIKKIEKSDKYQQFDWSQEFLSLGWRFIRVSANRLEFGKDKDDYLFITTIEDLTKTKELERNRDQLFSIVSHELKTPLTVIKGFGQLMEKQIDAHTDQKTEGYIRRMNDQVSRLASLIDELFDMSKIELGKFRIHREKIDLDSLVKETVQEMQLTDPTHKLKIKGKIDRPIHADKNRVRQVLINIINNAIKYSPDSKKVEINLSAKPRYASIHIQDFGIGIPAGDIKNIFDLFFQAGKDRRSSGLGLGLYISKQIMREHGGNILVDSKKGKGSVFTLILPFTN